MSKAMINWWRTRGANACRAQRSGVGITKKKKEEETWLDNRITPPAWQRLRL